MSIGPGGGGTVTFLEADSSSLYASVSQAGLFRSVDGGVSWTLLNYGLGEISDLLRVPGFPSILYAAVPGSGVYRSDNGGNDWRTVNGGLTTPATGPTGPIFPSLSVLELELEPNSTDVIYAATLGGLYKTIDGGASGWTQLPGAGLTSAVALDSRSPGTIYVGSGYGSILKSSDGGSTWVAVANPGSRVADLIVIESGTIYAGLYGAGVWKSQDGGASWTVLNTGLNTLYVDSLATGGTFRSVLYVSTVTQDDTLRRRVFRTTDEGVTWIPADDGLPQRRVFALAADPLSGRVVYAGTFGAGVYRSIDGGVSWTPANQGLSNFTINELRFDPSRPSVLYAGTSTGGLFRSSDSGASWVALPSPASVLALELDPVPPTTLHVGTAMGVAKSTDDGRTWTATPEGVPALSVTSLAIDPRDPSTLYAATPLRGVFRSTDGGETWVPSSNGLTDFRVVDLTVSPETPSSVFAAVVGAGVFRSKDAGESWRLVKADPTAFSVSADVRFPGRVYAGGFGSVSRTMDGGTTWSQSGRGLRERVVAIALDPKLPDRVYVATFSGVLRSDNGGMSWSNVGGGLSAEGVRSLAVHALDERVYAGTFFKSVFVKSDSDSRPTPSLPKVVPFRASLGPVAP